jgi:hypothetical protein
MYVQMWERPDDNTIICRVAWDNPAAKEMLQIWVPVHATLDEYTSPPGAGFVLTDAPTKLPWHIQQKAVHAAQELAMRFATAEVTSN